VVVDRFSKMIHFISSNKIDGVVNITLLFFRNLVQLHGVLRSIVSDRVSSFLATFGKVLWGKLGIKLLFFTTCHPQVYGQTRVANKTLTQLLRLLI